MITLVWFYDTQSKSALILIPSFVPAKGTTQMVPSSNAFLFSLKSVNNGPTKLNVLLEKRHQAIRRIAQKGPCWGEDKYELCFDNQQVTTEIGAGGVFNVSGVTAADPSEYFTGESSFQADDIQVFSIAGRHVCIR